MGLPPLARAGRGQHLFLVTGPYQPGVFDDAAAVHHALLWRWFPKHASLDWQSIAGTIVLHGDQGRRLILDLNERDLPGGEEAMRLTLEEDDQKYEPEELEAIKPLSQTSEKPSSSPGKRPNVGASSGSDRQ